MQIFVHIAVSYRFNLSKSENFLLDSQYTEGGLDGLWVSITCLSEVLMFYLRLDISVSCYLTTVYGRTQTDHAVVYS